MSKYIDADKLWNDRPQCPRGQSQEYDKGFWDCIFRFSELIHNGIKNSTADVVEVRHGEWREVNDKYPRYVCTVCNHLFNNKNYNYCPCCGAKMDGEERKNDT